VHVEDHPVEYADFEGIIPAGNYGAGAVIVWDQGRWRPLTDPDRLDADGKLHVEFSGYKLRGEYILVRTKRGEKDWLLFKKDDQWSRETPEWGDESVFSGLTVEELGAGKTRASEIEADLVKAKAPRKIVDPMSLPLMLAETADEPFSSKDWVFELKYDGYRLVAGRSTEGTVKLRHRNGMDVTTSSRDRAGVARFALWRGARRRVVVLDDQDTPSSHAQQRGKIRKARATSAPAVDDPATLSSSLPASVSSTCAPAAARAQSPARPCAAQGRSVALLGPFAGARRGCSSG
jgi:bifunctional non-homologous end joining protein LigD